MPNNAYLRSTRRERQLVNDLRAEGWIAARTAGSHSPFDVWSFHPESKIVQLIQVKTRRGGRTVTHSDLKTFGGCSVVCRTITWG